MNSGRKQVRTTRDRAARPDGNRHVQRNVLRHKVWQYKPEHFHDRQEVGKTGRRQDHLRQFLKMYDAQQRAFQAPSHFIEKWEAKCPRLGRHGAEEAPGNVN